MPIYTVPGQVIMLYSSETLLSQCIILSRSVNEHRRQRGKPGEMLRGGGGGGGGGGGLPVINWHPIQEE